MRRLISSLAPWSIVLAGAVGCDATTGNNDPAPDAVSQSDSGGGTPGQDTAGSTGDAVGSDDATGTGGDATESDTAGSEDTTGGGTPDGAALYLQQCASCHGAEGVGSSLGPSVRYVPKGFGDYVARHGRDVMPFAVAMPTFAPATLDDPSLTAIFNYLHTVARPTDGQGLYDMLCANCHGTDGAGGRVGEGVRGKANDVSEKVREGQAGNSYGFGSYMPAWSASDLTDSEASAIATYVQTL